MNQIRMTKTSSERTANCTISPMAIRAGVAAIVLCCFGASNWESRAIAQDGKKGDDDKPRAIDKPEEIDLETEDGVTLKATYYASNKGKEAVPVVLLHAYGGSQVDYKELALGLQALGHAVLTPDLRGHGESTQTKAGVEIKAEALRRVDFGNMALRDLETVKGYLLKENNAKKLNIERLCIVSAEMSTVVALNWAAADWSSRDLGRFKQGRDVKVLVLLSPESNFKGLATRQALGQKALREEISFLFVVGSQDRKAAANATRMYNLIARFHRRGDGKKEPYLASLPAKNQSTKLLGLPNLTVASLRSPSLDKAGKTTAIAAAKYSTEDLIQLFIVNRLVNNKKLRWTDRTPP